MDVLYNIKFALQGIKFRRRKSIPTFWLALVHNSVIWLAKLRFSSMNTPSNLICSAFLTSWLSMFKVLSSFSASIFLGLTVRDWNFSGLASRKFFLFEDYAEWPCVLSLDSTVPWVSPAAYSWWYQVRWSFFADQPRPKRPGDEVVRWPL